MNIAEICATKERCRAEKGLLLRQLFAGIGLGVLVVVACGVALWSGFIDIRWPWERFGEFTEVAVDVSLPQEARIVAVEPITLDCRARVYAEIPVEGVREYSAFGQVYRTDRVEIVAQGDIDTCVEGASAQVVRYLDGSAEVTIPGESIVFVRPRVDTVATASSVKTDKGFVGELTDLVPWIESDEDLTPQAYAYAQNVIGSSACTRTAYALTEGLLIDAYTQQFIDQGLDPDSLTVTIEGEPTFTDPEPIDMGALELSVSNGAATCRPADDLGGTSDPQQ